MRRLFTLLSTIALISSGASSVMACGNNSNNKIKKDKFVDTNLSTWGKKQFKEINKMYLLEAKTWLNEVGANNTWGDFCSNYYDLISLNDGLNAVITSWDTLSKFWNIDPAPNGFNSLKIVLAKGVHYYVKVDIHNSPMFKGKCNFIIKGNI